MEVTEKYANLVERQSQIALRAGQGLRMLHDDFDSDWKRGDEPHGTLTFTDEQPISAELERDLMSEFDLLKETLRKKGIID